MTFEKRKSPYENNNNTSVCLPNISVMTPENAQNNESVEVPRSTIMGNYTSKNIENPKEAFETAISGPVMSIRVIEEWIDETLKNADELCLAKTLVKQDKKTVIAQYGIDRHTLRTAGIPKDVVNRVYKCLFVYSTGFHELLKKLLQHTEGKYMVIKSIWRTFAVLLEYCCKTDYESLLQDIDREYKEQQQKIIDEYEDEIETLKARNKQWVEKEEQIKQYVSKMEKDTFQEKRMREKAEEEFVKLKDNIEEEVSLRMKFENKVSFSSLT